ncbi:MAG: hypothetical protein RSF01_06640 [Bacteroidales bacterium]
MTDYEYRKKYEEFYLNNLLRRVKTRNTYCNELSYRENALNMEAVFHPTSIPYDCIFL